MIEHDLASREVNGKGLKKLDLHKELEIFFLLKISHCQDGEKIPWQSRKICFQRITFYYDFVL